ncbi:hypothetical protein [Pseudomonas helleri]|uniref:SGNH/GDSL hydrolase family protein n=1 Tax=Pseudomonas helleri TaxID=1608996 RepID=A0A7X2CL86_9PSED|nr:hypothetical protein [Pseudomonas helleri]MQT98592.1 hypothetical protein [Pseudomonas helleri]MQU35477.1 hypothetical protein [Pseudomonas helleri]
MKITKKAAAISFIAALASIELAVRASGLTDFPLYDANNQIGYIPKPSQSGSFLNKNSWEFNSLSMGAGPFIPTDGINTLLVGDSIVLGGNPYRQEDRLGPVLQRESKNTIWPISAGSWSLRNELIYLKTHPEVLRKIDNFIFILNSDDFQQASSWSCEVTHPRSHPISSAFYVFTKYVHNLTPCNGIKPELEVERGDWKQELKDFISNKYVQGKPVTFFLYPKKTEAIDASLSASDLEIYAPYLMQKNNERIQVFSVSRDSLWSSDLYRDEIHPTVEGTKVLASIIHNPKQNIELK